MALGDQDKSKRGEQNYLHDGCRRVPEMKLKDEGDRPIYIGYPLTEAPPAAPHSRLDMHQVLVVGPGKKFIFGWGW